MRELTQGTLIPGFSHGPRWPSARDMGSKKHKKHKRERHEGEERTGTHARATSPSVVSPGCTSRPRRSPRQFSHPRSPEAVPRLFPSQVYRPAVQGRTYVKTVDFHQRGTPFCRVDPSERELYPFTIGVD